jgi:hypothetical protein
MSAIFDWLQNYWVDLASLLVQIAILATMVRYGRRLLGTLRASQEQIGALLKLSLSDGVAERSAPLQEPIREMETPRAEPLRTEAPRIAISEPQYEPVFAGAATRNSFAEREQSLGGRVIGAQTAVLEPPPAPRSEAPALTPWVSAPALEPDHRQWASHANPEPPHSRSVEPVMASRGGVGAWLQTPMRSSGISPMRKVIRWLQAPAGR